MGLLDRISAARGEVRYSADTYFNEYVMPFNYGGNSYISGYNGLVQTLAGNRATEIVNTLPGYAAALRQCPPAFAAQMVRALVISQARFTFRNRAKKTNFGTSALGILEKPWTNATTGELIARMEWHAGIAGNAYVLRQSSRLRVLRPDWVAILYGSQQDPDEAAHALDGELIGYIYGNGGLYTDRGSVQTLLPEDVAHWSPIPDPESAGVGMSWITPAIRDMQKDRMSGEHVIRYFEQGATPNLVVKGLTATTKEQFDLLVGMMEEKHAGVANAYRTLYLTAGADATVVGSNLADLDLKNVQGAAETRIASLSRVHPVILGIAEGLAGSSLNAGNFGMARRIWADTWIYPTLQDLASALGPIVDVPRDGELWFDVKDMPILREDGRDAAEIEQTKASTIVSLATGGFTRKSAIQAVNAQDMTLLEEDPNWVSVQLQQSSTTKTPNPKSPAVVAPDPKEQARAWNPALHPRDAKGRFRKLGGGDLALAGGRADVRHLTSRKLYALFADLLDEDPPNERALLLVSAELEAREDAARRRALARRNRMPANLESVSDDRLYELWSAHAADPEAVRRITTEINDRKRRAENRDRRALIDWSEHGSDEPAQRRINKAVAAGRDLVDAYAESYAVDDLERAKRLALVDLERRAGESRRDAVRRSYAEFTYLRYLDAENATRGHLLTPEAERAGIDPISLFSGPSARARKYASEDLKRWWEGNPRMTYTEFAAQVLTGDKKAAAAIKAQGNNKDFGV